MATPAATTGIGKAGIAFFGGLCVGTFGLGCWQTQRYFDKVELTSERERKLKQPPVKLENYAVCSKDELPQNSDDVTTGYYPPTETTTSKRDTNRTVLVTGAFRHLNEAYVGPRGPPPGALASSGINSGRSSGGMSSGPQGYFVITPLERLDGKGTVLVNRGWVPRHYVQSSANGTWDRPNGIVTVTGVTTKTDQPKYFSPAHGFDKDPRKLLWLDRPALEFATGTEGLFPILVTETKSLDESDNTDIDTVSFPAKPSVTDVGEFAITKETHAGYAFTWFGLSGAGMVMTRKLITRGRG